MNVGRLVCGEYFMRLKKISARRDYKKILYRTKTGAAKLAAASIIAGMFVFLAFIVPEHTAETADHGHCAICQFIQHTPLLEPEAVADAAPLFLPEWLPSVSGDTASHCPQLISALSRAPPLSIS